MWDQEGAGEAHVAQQRAVRHHRRRRPLRRAVPAPDHATNRVGLVLRLERRALAVAVGVRVGDPGAGRLDALRAGAGVDREPGLAAVLAAAGLPERVAGAERGGGGLGIGLQPAAAAGEARGVGGALVADDVGRAVAQEVAGRAAVRLVLDCRDPGQLDVVAAARVRVGVAEVPLLPLR